MFRLAPRILPRIASCAAAFDGKRDGDARTLAALPEESLVDRKPDLVRCAVEAVCSRLSLNGISLSSVPTPDTQLSTTNFSCLA